MMQWLLLALGTIMEVCGTACMKSSIGLLSGGLASSPILAAVRGAVRGGTVPPPAGFTAEEVITNITTGC
jgi:hypothetical protein